MQGGIGHLRAKLRTAFYLRLHRSEAVIGRAATPRTKVTSVTLTTTLGS